MKIKKPWEEIMKTELPASARDRTIHAANAIMRERAEKASNSSSWSWLWMPALGTCAAAAVAVVILTRSTQAPSEEKLAAFRLNPEMVREADMFYDLKVLRNYTALQKVDSRKWPKKKS